MIKKTKKTVRELFGDVSPGALAGLIGRMKGTPSASPALGFDADVPIDTEKKYVVLEISPAQEALLAAFYEKWLAVALSTAGANRARAEAGICSLYGEAGRKDPKIEWAKSPMEGFITTTFLGAGGESVTSDVWGEPIRRAQDLVQASVAPQVFHKVRAATLEALGDRVAEIAPLVGMDLVNRVAAQKKDGAVEAAQEMIADACFGCHDAAWLCLYDYCGSVFGLDLSFLAGHMEVARAGGWFWPMKTVVVATERPTVISLDDKGRLHSVDAQAIQYLDGYGVCAWHGVRVPEEAILSPAEVKWSDVETVTDLVLRDALTEIKALKWSGEDSEKFAATLAARRRRGHVSRRARGSRGGQGSGG